ncbi:MAG TPA: hypothetical protein VJJ02_00640 [Candidatus Paceibacterota bacterium]
MRKSGVLLVSLLLVIWSSVLFAAKKQEKVPSYAREEVYVPSKENCEERDTCDLEKVVFRLKEVYLPKEGKYDIELGWTRMYASYVTTSVGKIEKYLFVQFIRGSIFTSEMLPEGKVVKHFSVVRRHIDTPEGKILFRHPDWVVDKDRGPDPSMSADSTNPGDRHFFLEWSNTPAVWDSDRSQGNLYGEKKPTFPQVYVTDSPEAAAVFPTGIVRNTSLEFRTCLYRAIDVPLSVPKGSINFAVPIKCFEWAQSFVYDHAKQSWDHPVGVIDEYRRPLTPEEEAVVKILSTWLKDHPGD